MIISNSTVLLKIISCILLLMISLIVNFIHYWRKNRNFFSIILVISLLLYIIYYFLDYFVLKNDLGDYVAFNMLLSFLLAITFEDIKTNMMDTRVIAVYFVIFFVYRIVFLDLSIFLEGLIGFLISFVLLIIAYFIKRNSIGIGDIEAIATCGMIIGFPNIFHFIFKTFLFVFIVGLFLMVTKKKKLLSELPLAPFLLLATIL